MGGDSQYTAQRVVEAVPDAILVVDDDGAIRYANGAVRDLYGHDPDEVVGADVESLIPDRFHEVHARWRETYRDEPTRGQVGVGCDLRARRADGSTVPVDVSIAPAGWDDGRDVVAVVRDASERREYQRRIGTLREGTRCIMDAESREEIGRLVATVATELFGYESSVFRLVRGGRILEPVAVVGADHLELSDRPSYSIDEDNPVIEAYRSGEPVRYDDVREVDDGYDRGRARAAMYVPIGSFGVLSILDPDVGAFDRPDLELAANLAANAETILDRIRYEGELERQVDRLEEFASVVSHDLRNPLNVARGRLREAIETNGHRDALEPVDDALERMEAIVENTLTLARQGTVVGETEAVAVDDLARCCWGRVEAPDATVLVDDRFRIRADADRLEHVLENLFFNAVEHGGPGVTVRVGRLEDEPGFYVEDDGAGIPAAERDRIFDPGYSNAADGTGFGLAIVRRIAMAHGWTATVAAGDAGGARFEFTGVEVE